MDVPKNFYIIDSNIVYKDKTFSGYKKSDVIKAYIKSVEDGKIENACNWSIELILSGFLNILIEKNILIASKYINIHNPKIPEYIYSNLDKTLGIIKKYSTHKNNINLRNNQQIRDITAQVVCVLTLSKKYKLPTLPKIKNEDFFLSNMELRFRAKNKDLLSNVLKNGDPKEIIMPVNEFINSIFNRNINNTIYWLSWILTWEKLNIKKFKKYECGTRELEGVENKYFKDVIWLIWACIFKIVQFIKNNTRVDQIKYLYKIFKTRYSKSTKNSRIPLIIHAILFITENIDMTINLTAQKNKIVQAVSNINYIYKNLQNQKKKESSSCQQDLGIMSGRNNNRQNSSNVFNTQNQKNYNSFNRNYSNPDYLLQTNNINKNMKQFPKEKKKPVSKAKHKKMQQQQHIDDINNKMNLVSQLSLQYLGI
jgi:hypothetical protein